MDTREVISPKEASLRGLKSYFTGKPCKHGHIDLRSLSGGECYECRRIRCRQWHADNPENGLERRARFRKNNPDYFKDYKVKRPDVARAAQKRHRAKFPEKHVANNTRYCKAHPERLSAYRKKKRRSDPAYAVRQNMASRLAMAIRNGLGRKSANTMELVGCSLERLMVHLEAQFQEGMTWGNYGLGHDKWHVDHIRACALFNLANPAEQRRCFHYTNLQPLWQPENLRKGHRAVAVEVAHVTG